MKTTMRAIFRGAAMMGLACAAMMMFATASRADSVATFILAAANSGGPVCSISMPCASVKVDVATGGASATFTVSSLLNGYVFDNFAFNSTAAVTLVGGSGTGELGSYSLSTVNKSFSSWGKLGYEFDTGKSGGSNGSDCVVTGGVPGAGCTFSFEVKGTGLTLADFEVLSTKKNTYFSGHLANGNGLTGYPGDSVPVVPTPEPASLLLLGTGLLGVAGVIRRRFSA